MIKFLSISLLILSLSVDCVLSQVVVDTTRNAEYLVKEILLGQGVKVGNVKYTGEQHAISLYADQGSHLGMKNGILLTSGNAYYALGPNKSPRTGWASSARGDIELEAIARGKTWDAAVLEFDFVTTSENLSFRYVFASEEYLEYVGTKFNDVFGFFISRKDEPKINVAMLPDGKTPITINTINNKLNSQYYIDNTYHNTTDPFVWDARNRKVVDNKYYLTEEIIPEYDTQFDGFTTVLEARYKVIPNQVYHIKLAIADVGDGILDSGVFLEAGSFISEGEILVEIDDHFTNEIQLTKLKGKTNTSIATLELPDLKIKIPQRKKVGQIEFEFDKYTLTTAAASTIAHVFSEWNNGEMAKIELAGHTDNFGSNSYNETLSKRRTEAVAKMLVELGVPENLIAINYFGEKSPLADNNTEYGRAKNRRVEFYFVL